MKHATLITPLIILMAFLTTTTTVAQEFNSKLWLKQIQRKTKELENGSKHQELIGTVKVLKSKNGNKGNFTCEMDFTSSDRFWPMLIKKGSSYLQPTIWYNSYKSTWVLLNGNEYKMPEGATKFTDLLEHGIGHWMDNYYWKSSRKSSFKDAGSPPKPKDVPTVFSEVKNLLLLETKKTTYTDGSKVKQESGTIEVTSPTYNAGKYEYKIVYESGKTWHHIILKKEGTETSINVYYNAQKQIFEPADEAELMFSVKADIDDTDFSNIVSAATKIWMARNSLLQ